MKMYFEFCGILVNSLILTFIVFNILIHTVDYFLARYKDGRNKFIKREK